VLERLSRNAGALGYASGYGVEIFGIADTVDTIPSAGEVSDLIGSLHD